MSEREEQSADSAIATDGVAGTQFRHEAWLYAGDEEFLPRALGFIGDGLERGEAVMVAVPPPKATRLERLLGVDAARVTLVDMAEAGRNPGRILPLWRVLVDRARSRGRRARGIGEPVWRGRSEAELDECHRHEALLNLAFPDDAPFWLLCPYDTTALDDETLASLERTHPHLRAVDAVRSSRRFDARLGERAFAGDLPEPPANADRFRFDRGRLAKTRAFVGTRAEAVVS